jgi:HK97 family phage major capsid protein
MRTRNIENQPYMKTLAQLNAAYETNERARNFAAVALHLMRAPRSNPVSGALADAEQSRASPQVIEILKAAVVGGSLGDASWAGSLSAYRTISNGFVEMLRNVGVFDRMLAGGMRRLPLRTRIAITTAAGSGSTVAESKWKPVTNLSLSGADILAAQKASCIICMTDELARLAPPAAIDLLGTELRAGVVAATDAAFIATLIDTISSIPSLGQTASAAVADLRALLTAIDTNAQSRVFVITTPLIVKQLAMLYDDGGLVFLNLTPTGGEISGMTVMASDQVATGNIIMVDATGICGESDVVTLDSSTAAALQMSATPTDSAQPMVSLFQSNMVGLKAERWFGADRLRDSAVAVLEGASYDDTESG